jgi:pimeloyl-ACP methyl ester carboxylesterase
MKLSIKRFIPVLLTVSGLLLMTLFLFTGTSVQADPIVNTPTLDVEIVGDVKCEQLKVANLDCAAAAGSDIYTGTLDGANYRIRVPAGWDNGKLVVYAHAYRDKADFPGDTDNTSAYAAPGDEKSSVAMEDALLALGYAVAGSAFRDNGWAVEEGISDTLALTNYFSETIGAPSRTILWGFSIGAVVTFKSIELYPDVYDGAIPACAVGAGTSLGWDASMAMALAYDVAFGWPAAWGTFDDVAEETLDFETVVAPTLVAQVFDNANLGGFEFVRLVGGLPEEEFYDPNGSNWLFTDMYFTTEARAELERRAGGSPTQNANHIYSLTDDEKAYLGTLGVDADALLAEMNAATTIEADPAARAYLESYADYTGNIPNPVLTLHTTVDGLIAASNETVYAETVAAAGASDNLVQTYTESVGHCTFSGEQLITTLTAMDNWLETGTAPTDANFPTALGFVPDFDPGPWPIEFSDQVTSLSLTDFNGQASSAPLAWLAVLPMLFVGVGLFLRRRK